jgi:hypothetical protein
MSNVARVVEQTGSALQTIVQISFDDDLVNLPNFFCECLAVMLGVDSDNQSDICNSPGWLETM